MRKREEKKDKQMEDTKKRYSIECPVCKKKLQVVKSIGHIYGALNSGCTTCIGCRSVLHLTYMPKLDEMQVMEWNTWMNTRGVAKGIKTG